MPLQPTFGACIPSDACSVCFAFIPAQLQLLLLSRPRSGFAQTRLLHVESSYIAG